MANIIYRAKRPVGRGPAVRQPSVVPVNNEIRQRVLSARRLRMKTFQNQLADAQQTIAVSSWKYTILLITISSKTLYF